LLEQKEVKIQDKPDPSGRFRAVMMTLMVAKFAVQ